MTTYERHVIEEVLDELGKDRHNVKYQTLAKLETLVDGNTREEPDTEDEDKMELVYTIPINPFL